MFEPIVDEKDRCIDGGGHVLKYQKQRMDFVQRRIYEVLRCSKCGYITEAWVHMNPKRERKTSNE